MKKLKVILPLIIVLILLFIGIFLFTKYHNKKNNINSKNNSPTYLSTNSNKKNSSSSTNNKISLPTPLFTNTQKAEYYKLSTVEGDIGLPSSSLVTNLDNYITVNGIKYFDSYSYDTRASYKSPVLREDSNNNFAGEIKENHYVGLNGTILSNTTEKSSENINNLSNEEKYVQLYKIASEYIEGYTANYPNVEVQSNDNYEGNLNDITNLKINLNDSKEISNHKVYKVTVSLNNFTTDIYVSLDGYIFVPTAQAFEQLFFPGWLNENIPIVNV